MNWTAVRRHNNLGSQRKKQREARAAERDARITRAGGQVTVAEVRTATRRLEPPNANRIRTAEVWTIRGKDWVIGFEGGCIFPFQSWRMDATDGRDYLPLTAGASKWVNALPPIETP